MSIDQSFYDSLAAAPSLTSSPDLATAAASSSDPATNAQVLAQSQDMAAATAAVQHQAAHHGGLLGGLFHAVGSGFTAVAHTISSGLQYLAKPLGDVQHDYRYLHDLWTKSDPASATLATLGVIGGGVAGAFVGGAAGAALGADAVGSLEGHLAGTGLLGGQYKNLYQQSATEKISPGRDVANLLGVQSTDHGIGKLVSGAADAAFDFRADPLMGAGRLAAARRSATGLTETYAARNIPAIRSFLVDHGFGGLGMQDSVDGGINALDRIAAARESNPQYNRAITAIADSALKGGAGAVVSEHPQISRMAGPIGQAIADLGPNASREAATEVVHQQFLLSASNAEMLSNGYGMLPSRTLMRNLIGSPLANKIKAIGEDTTPEQQGGLLAALNPRSPVTLTGAAAQKVRTFSGYLPYTIDRSTEDGRQLLNLSNTKFDPSDPGALRGIYQSMRFSLGEKAAQQVTNDFAIAQAAGDLDQMKLIYASGYKKMLVAAGVPDDSLLVKNLSDHIDSATDDLKARQYGFGYQRGTDVNQVAHVVPARPTDATDNATTVTTDLGLWDHQAGQFSYPNFWQVKNAVRALGAVKNHLGGVDQAISDYYTNSIFKPLALVNAGFGLRVAAAEALPASFRYGALNMIQNRVAASAAKHAYKLDSTRLLDQANIARETGDEAGFLDLTKQAQDTQVGHVTAAVGHLIGGMSKLLRINDDDLDLATNIVARGQGDVVWGVGRAGHQQHRLPINAADRANTSLWLTANTKQGVRATGNYTLFNPSNQHYDDMWHGQLSRVAGDEAGQNIAKDLLAAARNGMDGDSAARYATEREANRIAGLSSTGKATPIPPYALGRKVLSRYKVQDPVSFAADRVDALRNLLTGQDGTFHTDLAAKVAKGTPPDLADVGAKPLDQAPRQVPGLELAPTGPVQLFNEAINKGFTHLVDPIINYLSREPLFYAGVKEQMPALQSAVDRGVISQEDAYQHAMYRATEAMLPQIHNVQLRSQFAAMARNFMPFYFAQEQAIRRTAHLITVNPAALRQYQQVSTSLSDPNFVHVGANGQQSLMIPYSNVMGPLVIKGMAALTMPVQTGLPLSFTGSMSSLASVLPEMKPPGISPLLSVPLNEIAKFFPEWQTPVKNVLGAGYGQSLKDELIPNSFLRNGLVALEGPEQDRQFANAFTSALTAAAMHGQLPDANASPAEQQAALDRIKNNTRTTFALKAILSLFSPLAPQPVAEDFGLRDEFTKLLADKKLTYAQAVDKFIAEHGSAAVSYTIGKTSSTTGAFIPSTQAAADFISGNQDLIRNHVSAAYFVPEANGPTADGLALHNEQVLMGLRATTTPPEFLNQMYIKAGDQQYYTDKAVHDAQLAKLTDPTDIANENAAWAAHVTQLKQTNVIWAADFTSEARNLRAIQLYADMRNLFASGKAPDSPQTAGIKGLMDDFQTHLAALAQLPQDRSGGADRTAEKNAWQTYLDQQAKDHPELSNVITNIFKRLDARL